MEYHWWVNTYWWKSLDISKTGLFKYCKTFSIPLPKRKTQLSPDISLNWLNKEIFKEMDRLQNSDNLLHWRFYKYEKPSIFLFVKTHLSKIVILDLEETLEFSSI